MLNSLNYISVRNDCLVDDYITSNIVSKHVDHDFDMMIPVKTLDKFFDTFFSNYEHMAINKRFKTICQQSKDEYLCKFIPGLEYFEALEPNIQDKNSFWDLRNNQEDEMNFVSAVQSLFGSRFSIIRHIHSLPASTVINIKFSKFAELLDFVEEFHGLKSPDGTEFIELLPVGQQLIRILENGHGNTYGKNVLNIVN